MQWYHIESDGTASVYPMDGETNRLVDKNPQGWFATPESLVLHGGVQACAFKIETVQYYDSRAWIACGKLIPSEKKTRIVITAKP